MCIPVDAILWGLVGRIRDDGYRATREDLRALIDSGCAASRAREVLAREAALHPAAPFAHALSCLDEAEPPR